MVRANANEQAGAHRAGWRPERPTARRGDRADQPLVTAGAAGAGPGRGLVRLPGQPSGPAVRAEHNGHRPVIGQGDVHFRSEPARRHGKAPALEKLNEVFNERFGNSWRGGPAGKPGVASHG